MKRTTVFLFTILTLMCAVNAHSQQIDIDLSSSTFAITGPGTFSVYNVSVSAPEFGVNGTYFVGFQWDPSNYIFVPVTVGGPGYVTPPAAIDATGNYSGLITGVWSGYSPQQTTFQVNISQTNSTISGTYSNSEGDSGTVTGTVTGTNTTFTFSSSLCTNSGTAQGSLYKGVLNFSGNGNLGVNCRKAYSGAYIFYGMLTLE